MRSLVLFNLSCLSCLNRLGLLLLLCLSQAWCLRPGIPRVTWTTDHFTLTIDEKKQDLLPGLASLAEECWAKENAFFGYAPPGRIQMVFLDEQDYANGFAYPPQKWVVIHLHSAEHLLRGRTRWLQGVMSHEIGHIFTLRRMGEDSRFLGVDLFHAWRGKSESSFEESFAWRYGLIPPWLAEGLAQYAAGVCGYDTLDTHRQMVLRVAAASGTLMSLAELKTFAWDGRRNEMIYAQGYGLVSHCYRTYGPKAANRYLELAAGQGWRRAFRTAFGKPIEDIYQDWRKDLETRSRGSEGAGDGDYLLPEPPGPYTVESFPAPLPGKGFLYLSSGDNDNGRTDLRLADGEGGSRQVFERATSVLPAEDGQPALFTATRYAFAQGDVVSDLYSYAPSTGDVERLTRGGRIIRGCRSGGQVYGIRNNDARTTIVRIAGGEWTTVFAPPDSMEITDLAPGRSPGSLTLGTTSGFGEDLRELDLASGELSPLAVSPQEERDPSWHGDTLYFSADYSGIFDVYALAGETLIRCTHVAGGAFHPQPREDGIWFSSYGPKGFRLARARPLGDAAPSFVVELPVPGWKPPPAAEYESDAFDRTNLGLLGFNLSLGFIRSPGFESPELDSALGASAFAYGAGTRTLTSVGFYWQNPTGVADASVILGLSRPLDYQGPMHLDATAFRLSVNAFLPTLVLEGRYDAFDFPDVRLSGRKDIFYQGYLAGYVGPDLRLSEHWDLSGRFSVENGFGFQGSSGDKVTDTDPRFGGLADLDYTALELGKDGVTQGFSAFLHGEKPPKLTRAVPEFSATAGATAYASMRRALFLRASLYHTEDWGPEEKGWLYGGASAYYAVPLGMQLGTRGGSGLFLDQAYPGIEYRDMSRFTLGGGTGSAAGFLPGPAAGPESGQGYSPRSRAFTSMINRVASHEVGVTLALKTLTFFPRPETWEAGLFFDAADFGRRPVWSVRVSL